MFTGLIETVGKVTRVTPGSGSTRISVAGPLSGEEIRPGESIAVDGVCLTAVVCRADGFDADAVAETLARTTLGKLRAGQRVNLERALRVGDRIGGHLVQGHVDGMVAVSRIKRSGDDHRVEVQLPSGLRRYVAMKGSVALHGVSLTVSAVTGSGFEVALVPQTLGQTTLGKLRTGDRLNLEVDVVSRYLERLSSHPDSGWAGSRGPGKAGQDR